MRILLVEDQDAIRNMIQALVKARGYQVAAVNSGAAGLESAREDPPDVVLLDLMMPGQFDGFEVCRRLRAEPRTQGIPVVVVSALDDDATKRRVFEVGATAYYSKPFSPIALLQELDRIGRHGTQR